MSDIINYAYIWYKRDSTKLLEFTPEEQDIIFKIILDYSYPCYLANDSISSMSDADKTELLEHELLFIQKKFIEAGLIDVVIIQIPRVLYDLFNLLYYKTYNLDLRFNYHHHTTIDTVIILKIKEYNNLTFRYTEEAKHNILQLNYLLISFIKAFLDNITIQYNRILEIILDRLNKAGILLLEESKIIIRQIIIFEKEPSEGYIILYRGAKIDKDSTIDGAKIQSLSLNISILSGFINDKTACTLNYIEKNPRTVGNDKIKYIIKKFHILDRSNEYSLFFIPPIHPFLQLYCDGELWHPRTKIGYDFLEKLDMFDFKKNDIKGIGCSNGFIKDSDYLLSNKTIQELECLYEQYKSTGQISVWQKKYLKYKNKYLELKNSI